MSAKSPARRVGLLACWISSLVALLQLSAAGQCRLDKAGWQLDARLSEDFGEGTTLATLARHWHFDLQGGPVLNTSSSAPAYEPYISLDNISVAGGCAYLNTRRLPTPHHEASTNRDYEYSTACLRSRLDEFPDIKPAGDTTAGGVFYGMFEIRCKLPGKPGQYPSLWLIADNGQAELDAFEFNATHPNQFFSTVHWDAAGTPRPKYECGTTYTYPARYLTTDFHTWTLVWTPTRITWFFEGRELKTIDLPERIPGAAATRTTTPVAQAVGVYPNPATDVLNLTNLSAAQASVRVFSLQGAEMRQARYDGSGQLQVQNLPKGLYCVDVTDASGRTSHQRFEKQ